MKKKNIIVAFGLVTLTSLVVISCGDKVQNRTGEETSKQETRSDYKGADRETNQKENAKAIAELKSRLMIPEDVGNAFQIICETDYLEKSDESGFRENETLKLASGPITAKLPAKSFAVLEGTEYPTARVRLGDNGMRHAYVTLLTATMVDNGVEDTKVFDRMYNLARDLQRMREESSVVGLSAEVKEIGKQKWVCLTCQRITGSGESREVKETKRYISFLANRKVEIRFSYFVTSEEREGRRKSPFSDKLMHRIVASVATVPVDQYKKPAGLSDLEAAVDINHIQENIDFEIEGLNEDIKMISIGNGQEARSKFIAISSGYVLRTVQIGQGLKRLRLEDKSSLMGDIVQTEPDTLDAMTTLVPRQYYDYIPLEGRGEFTEEIKTFKNKTDYNPESYISVGVRHFDDFKGADDRAFFNYLSQIADDLDSIGFDRLRGYREEMQAGIQIYGDKLFFVTIELSNATQPYGKSVIKRAFLYHYPYLRIVTFTDYGEELKPLTQGEIEVLKSMSYTPLEKDQS